MPLQLTIYDETTGIEYIDSVHVIEGVANFNMRQKTCSFVVCVYSNVAALAAGKQPIQYNGWGRPFTLIECNGSDFDSVIAQDPTTEEVALALSPLNFFKKRAEEYLKTLTGPDFDYTGATII